MDANSIIIKKRDGEELTSEEIHWFIQGVTQNSIPDYQASALLMAIYFQGMSLSEIVALTEAMIQSGEVCDLSELNAPIVDKHSTGGVGDKVSLILAPLAAACGLKVPMMSGRGLGHSGGTLDKLQSISGFQVSLSQKKVLEILKDLGCVMIGQTEKIAPADKKLYAIRDVTGTVESLPLITASILSKKFAEGTKGLVLDIKVGSGAFMKNKTAARELADSLTRVGKKLGLSCKATLTNMDQPLGYAVGNALEVIECIEVLRNQRFSRNEFSSSDLKEVTLELCAQMLLLGKKVKNTQEGRKLALQKLSDGSAWEIFQKMVEIQGGDLKQILDPSLLPRAKHTTLWGAPKSGYLTRIDTTKIGWMTVELGGGRKTVTDKIDHGVGFLFHRKLGARLKAGDPIVTVHHSDPPSSKKMKDLETRFLEAIEISSARKPVPRLILK